MFLFKEIAAKIKLKRICKKRCNLVRKNPRVFSLFLSYLLFFFLALFFFEKICIEMSQGEIIKIII